MRMTIPVTAPSIAGGLTELCPPGDLADPTTTATWVRGLLDNGLLNLPLPGRGETAERFRALAQIGQIDLDLARLAEAHTDAWAILTELTDEVADQNLPALDTGGSSRLWGVWAANPPTSAVIATRSPAGWRLDGTKPWCSGAGCCDAALVTAQAVDGYRLFAVDLHDPSVRPVEGSWPARSMRGSDSRSVCFTASPAAAIGGVDAYLSRPGFWHGAVGVAATWLGGAFGVAEPVWETARRRPLHAHALAHAGAIDSALAAAKTMLDQAAHAIDADPVNATGNAELTARRVRAVVERAAAEVVDRVGRALGAAPLALEIEHAKRVGDLALYLRQSHAERDLEALGTLVVEFGGQQ
jgi:alkylation response protein AidB-like acyl-CoA dehydrogenase